MLDPYERGHVTVSMRQGLGLIVVFALVAGVIPLLANLWLAIPMGAAVPLALVADTIGRLTSAFGGYLPLDITGYTAQTLAGVEPRMPGFLAALLSALGIWLNWPLGWLTNWIGYGVFVAGLARLMGAHNTLQSFFAATSFVAVPLLLLGLYRIPILGPIAMLTAVVWGFFLYYRIVRYVTRLDVGRTLLSMLLPIAVLLMVPLILSVLATFLLFG